MKIQSIKNAIKKVPFIYKPLKFINRNPKKSLSDIIWFICQFYEVQRLKLMPIKKLNFMKNELSKARMISGPLITVTFGSFHIGNRDPLLKKFFTTFLKFTKNPDKFEFLIKIDEGDDYVYYYKIKKYFENKINLRFFLTPRGRGYADMHLWHSDLIKYRSPSSKALYILTEDAVFHYHNWDDELINLVQNRKNSYFIATPCDLHEATRIVGPSPEKPVPVYWVRGDDFPIFGFDLLNATEKFTQDLPDWVALGNLFNVDGFSGDLLRIAINEFQVNLHEQTTLFALRKGVYDWSENPVRGNLRNKTLLEFFYESNVKIRSEMVKFIIKSMKEESPNEGVL